MKKKDRFVALVDVALRESCSPPRSRDDQLDALDCAMSMPDAAIPDRDSLRHFTHEFLRLFFTAADEVDGLGEADFPRMRKWVLRWRQRWTPEGVRLAHANDLDRPKPA